MFKSGITTYTTGELNNAVIKIWWFGDDLRNRLLLLMLGICIDALRIEIMCLKDSLKDRLLSRVNLNEI